MSISLTHLASLPLFWLFLFLIFLLLEMVNGSAIFFLPLSLSAFVFALITTPFMPVFFQDLLIAKSWHWIVVQWILLAILISYGLMHYRHWHKKRHPDETDINDY